MAGAALMAQGVARRRAIVRFVKGYWRRHGYAPSVAEIAVGVELSSKTAVRHHLGVLQRENKIKMEPGVYRSVRIVEKKK